MRMQGCILTLGRGEPVPEPLSGEVPVVDAEKAMESTA